MNRDGKNLSENSDGGSSKSDRRSGRQKNLIANRRGTDMEPNEPFDVETDPLRLEDQPFGQNPEGNGRKPKKRS